jgi:FdhD protein
MKIATRTIIRLAAGDRLPGSSHQDVIVAEEPLEIRVAGEPLAITMRTPGHDAHLALGFLFAEGVIGAMGQVGGLVHCGRPGDEAYGNAIDVTPAPGVVLDPGAIAGARRGTLTTAACGVCGRRSIEDLLARCVPVPTRPPLDVGVLRTSTVRLAEQQPNFMSTGGIHAAALLGREGDVRAAAEDAGRHNAVDKVVGALLEQGVFGSGSTTIPADFPALLVVSGRVSFEIVQKAAVAGVGAVAGVSAPTSLAVDLAQAAGITLAGFVRGGSLNLYAHAERVR